MQGMQTRHAEVEGKEELYLWGVQSRIAKPTPRYQVLFKLVRILHGLDAQKHQPKQHGEQQEADQLPALTTLGRMHRQRHGKTATDQYGRIDTAQYDVQVMTAGGESLRIGRTIHRISRKQTAKEHDLGQQEDPYAERGGLILLRAIVKVVGQSGRRLSQCAPPEGRRHTPLRSPWASARSCPWVGVKRFAIPSPWRPTGWDRRLPHSVTTRGSTPGG